MSRIENTSKNFVFSLLATVVTAITSFVSRTVFIHTIGVDYLGGNKLGDKGLVCLFSVVK